jgi:excisionase family DNA binding protein
MTRLPDRDLLTTAEVGKAFGVSGKTVARWCSSGWVPSIATPGGHRRIPRTAVVEMLRLSATDPYAPGAGAGARDEG